MPKFSKISEQRLRTCDKKLQNLFNFVINYYDCVIICGTRDMIEQNKAFDEGNSKLRWPNSKHNKLPSLAVDVAPCINGRISWDPRLYPYFAGLVKGIAICLGIDIIWGGNWNDDEDITDNKFNDLVHFELK